ncbi:MAG: energy transducer TonB [Bacteroidota bacterium]
MKNFLFIFFFTFFIFNSYSQKVGDPRAIYSKCRKADDHQTCLYNILQEKIVGSFNQTAIDSIVNQNKRDTIIISASILINENGKIDINNSLISTVSEFVQKMAKSALGSLESFDMVVDNIGNPLSEMFAFNIYYAHQKNQKKSILTPLPIDTELGEDFFSFAVIEEVPVFKGCEDVKLVKGDMRKCFQQKMVDHIKVNFRYPKKAIKQNITGRVHARFIIDKNGEVTNISTIGPHPLLEKETKRIMEKIPQMRPGLQKGKPVRVPFSIPLTFKL